MIATPWSPIVPETSTLSPGRTCSGASGTSCSRTPTPVVTTYIESHFPRSTTLVSPVTTGTPAARAASAMAVTSARRTSAGSPSSSTRATDRASGRAPDTARSLTVPLTASSPIEPPGNRIGRTTKASVVSASRAPPTSSSAASPSGASASFSSSGTITPSTRARLALPPAPCAMVIRSSTEPRPPPAHRLDALADLVLG